MPRERALLLRHVRRARVAAPTERVAASFAETLVHSEPAATLLNGELVTETLAAIYRELSPMFMLLLWKISMMDYLLSINLG